MRHLALVADPRGAENASDAPRPIKGNLLIVDADDFLIEMIETGLTLARPRWQIIAARRPSDALAVLERHSELDAIITEILFDHSSEPGKMFIREVGRRWPDIPVFVMTHSDPEETRGLETAEYIAKPPDMDFLVSRIDRSIRRQRESRVRGISLPTFLQILELERKSCTLFVAHGGRVGELYVRDGNLVQARLDGVEGEEALYAMLSMPEHSLRVIDKCEVDGSISARLGMLLVEWSVREDHGRRGRAASHEED
jgi:DNA-binding response OmpR family regulator